MLGLNLNTLDLFLGKVDRSYQRKIVQWENQQEWSQESRWDSSVREGMYWRSYLHFWNDFKIQVSPLCDRIFIPKILVIVKTHWLCFVEDCCKHLCDIFFPFIPGRRTWTRILEYSGRKAFKNSGNYPLKIQVCVFSRDTIIQITKYKYKTFLGSESLR